MSMRRPLLVLFGLILLALPTGPVEAQPGQFALRFDGAASFVWLGQPLPERIAQGTVEVWFRLDDAWDNGPQLPLIGDDFGQLNLVLRDRKLAFNKDGENTSTELTLEPARLAAGWHHAAGVWGQGGMKLLLDGKLVATRRDDEQPYVRAKTPYESVPVETRLGLSGTWWGEHRSYRFAGQIGFVRIAAQRLYEADFEPKFAAPIPADAEILRYDFAAGQGTTLADASGHGHDGKVAGCTWERLSTVPTLSAGPAPTFQPVPGAVVVLPFQCQSEMQADITELEGFGLTTGWVLNTFARLPVATEDHLRALTLWCTPPYRDRPADEDLSHILDQFHAQAVVTGFIETEGDGDREDRTRPARLTLRVVRPGQNLWTRTINLPSQSLDTYATAQQAAARAVFELLAPQDLQQDLAERPTGNDLPAQVRALQDQARGRFATQETFALLRATTEAAEAVALDPRRAASWRLLAESYAWLGASPSRSYSTAFQAALSRARAAHNVAVLLAKPDPETTLTGALIDRFVPDYLGARASGVRLLGLDHAWSPAQRLTLALVLGEEKGLPASGDKPEPLDLLTRGIIRTHNAQQTTGPRALQQAWAANRQTTAAPILLVERSGAAGLGLIQQVSATALGPGLVQATRILAWQAARTNQGKAGRDFLARLAQANNRRPPDLTGKEADLAAVDEAADGAINGFGWFRGLDQERALALAAVIADFDRQLVHDGRRQAAGFDPAGTAIRPDPVLVARFAQVEAESGFYCLARYVVQSLGDADGSFYLLDSLVTVQGSDTLTAYWSAYFLSRHTAYKGRLPFPPATPRFDPGFEPGYLELIYLEPTYQPDVYRDARRRVPFLDMPYRQENRPGAFERFPFNLPNIRQWVLAAHGPDRRARLDRVIADLPESIVAQSMVAQLQLRDPAARDEARGLATLQALLTADPNDWSIYPILEQYYLDTGRPDDAVAWAARLAARPVPSLAPANALVRIGEIERARHRPDAERQALQRAAPSFQGAAVVDYARALAEAGQINESVQLFEAAIDRYPPGESAAAWEGAALFKMGHPDQARAVIRKYVESHPYSNAAAAARYYYRRATDAPLIVDLQNFLEPGRSGNLVLARAALDRDQTDRALAAARRAQELGKTSTADDGDDSADAALVLAEATGVKYTMLRAAGMETEARQLIEDYARRNGLTNLAALLAPIVVPRAAAIKPEQADAWTTEALTRLGEVGHADDPGSEVARRLAVHPDLGATLRPFLGRAVVARVGADNQLRLAVSALVRPRVLPIAAEQALAAALVRLNLTRTWVSVQAAVVAAADPETGRATFLDLIRGLKDAGVDTNAAQLAADSWPDWHLLGPIADTQLDGINRPYLAEARPIDLAAPVRVEGTEFRWSQPHPGQTWGGLNLAASATTSLDPTITYAYRVLAADAPRSQRFVLEGPQSARVWLNGREITFWVHSPEITERMEIELPLQQGRNDLLIKLRYPARAQSQPFFGQFPAGAAD